MPSEAFESRAKVAGHALHPILIVFPLGLLSAAAAYDALYLATKKKSWATSAHQNIGTAVVTSIAAAVPGWIDWFAIPCGTRAKRIGLWHGGGNALVLGLAGLSWLARNKNPDEPDAAALTYSFASAGLGVLTGWLGGELVHRLAVSVDDGAGLNAQNSLAGPADDAPEGDALERGNGDGV